MNKDVTSVSNLLSLHSKREDELIDPIKLEKVEVKKDT